MDTGTNQDAVVAATTPAWSGQLAEMMAWFEGNPNLPEKIGESARPKAASKWPGLASIDNQSSVRRD